MSPTIRAARMSMHPDDFFLPGVFGCGQKKSPKKSMQWAAFGYLI